MYSPTWTQTLATFMDITIAQKHTWSSDIGIYDSGKVSNMESKHIHIPYENCNQVVGGRLFPKKISVVEGWERSALLLIVLRSINVFSKASRAAWSSCQEISPLALIVHITGRYLAQVRLVYFKLKIFNWLVDLQELNNLQIVSS